MRHQPYLNVFGAVTHSDKTDGVFDINVTQYESHYKTNRTLSVLPVRAEFNLNKYKTKKPIPSDNTYVAVEGFLADIDTDTTGHAFLFHIKSTMSTSWAKHRFRPHVPVDMVGLALASLRPLC